MAASLLAISDYWWGWANLLFRWLHVIAAIAWIGISFYFIALDNHLAPPAEERDAERGVGGEVWEIHGGGFYRVEKFRSRRRSCPSPSTGSSGRRTRPGSRASRCSSSCSSSTRGRTSSTRA